MAENVKAAQEALRDKGFDPGPVDGVMGPQTRKAVMDFQRKEGLKTTGRLDVATSSRLGMQTSTSGDDRTTPSASPKTDTKSEGAKTEKP